MAFFRPLSYLSTLRYRTFALYLKLFFVLHLTYSFIGSVGATHGASMLPTMRVSGEIVYTSKRYARGNGIKVGDLVEFKHPLVVGEGAIKRVMGLSGDFVRADGGMGKGVRMIQVPEGHCWLLGDNLPESRDSRTYGPLPMALIRGKVAARIWPPSSIGKFGNTLQQPEEDP